MHDQWNLGRKVNENLALFVDLYPGVRTVLSGTCCGRVYLLRRLIGNVIYERGEMD